MKPPTLIRVAVMTLAVLAPAATYATPSTSFWTVSTANCQAKGVPHITYDTYYAKGIPPPAAGARTYPIDTGLTIGVLPSNKVQAEVGYDLLLPSSDPLFFFVNAKLCTPESSLFKGSPAIGGGIYNVGYKKNVTNFDVPYLIAQKGLPRNGYVAAGLYHGTNDVLFTNSDGEIRKTGAIIGFFSPDIPVGLKGLNKLNFTADVQTGKNVLGGGGAGLYLYFNQYISLLVGPVWFTDRALQPGGARYLWTTQLDVDIPLGK